MQDTPGALWTIGHSTRPFDVFAAMLVDAGVRTLVDVRRFAGSRRNPQYSGEAMGESLAAYDIAYVPMPGLGGRRPAQPDSPHTAWRNASFRGYADYMHTPAYRAARDSLERLAREAPTAVMCAEAMWWQCHRGLISDDFKARGWTVVHVLAPNRADEHPFTGAARLVDGRLDYSLPEPPQQALF